MAGHDTIDHLHELIDLLLVGNLRTPSEVDALKASGVEYDPWLEFDSDWPPANLPALWRAHRAALMTEAERRGIREPWGLRFDAEGTCAAG